MSQSPPAEALDECLRLDENSTFGYGSYSYLIVQILDFGRKKSRHFKIIDFFEDEKYAWYIDKRDIGLEIINKALTFWTKYNKNKKDDFQEAEKKQSHSGSNKFENIINNNHSRLLIFKDTNKKILLSKSKEAKTKELQILWQNAYIDKVLGEKDFSNYNSGLTNLNSDDLKEIVELLRTSLEHRPTLRDLKRWLKATRTNQFNIDIQTSINFLEFINTLIINNQKQSKVMVIY